MNSIQFEDAVRDYIREPRIASSIDGANFGSAAIGRYRTRAEREAYFITITKAKHLYIATYSIVGVTGQELYDIPGYGALDAMKRLMRGYKVTDPTNVRNQYREVSFDAADTYTTVRPAALAFYHFGNQIGILPNPATGETIRLVYYEKYNPMTTTEQSDLPDVSQDYAVVKTAKLCLTDRADANFALIDADLKDIEMNQMSAELSRTSRLPQELFAGEQLYGGQQSIIEYKE